MNTVKFHIPSEPKQATPPAALERAVAHPPPENVVQLGLTTTREGEWALLARVAPQVRTPIPAVELLAHGHPVVYQATNNVLPIARPAFPGLGE